MKQEIIPKPWGRERLLETNDKYAVKILEVDAGKRLSLQYHEVKIETMYCMYGHGTLHLQQQDGSQRKITLLPGRYITIFPFEVHRLEASATSPLIIMESSSAELEDIVRLEDDYDRP